jgi:hypothetical protein
VSSTPGKQGSNNDGPSFRGVIGTAREQITPPPGIYSRCWAAAKHDVAAGVHRPMTLTCLTFQTDSKQPPLVLMGLDLMTWRSREDEWFVRNGVLEALGLPPERLMMCLSHTHASPAVQRTNADKPGGHLIASYLEQLRGAAIKAAGSALKNAVPATLTWRYGKCDLAANRDFPEPVSQRILCGFNPAQSADDTLLVGRISASGGTTLATIVNYACHPTTLAWENQLISPDYVGALRESVEAHAGGLCLFIQGASAELAPAEQYVSETHVADRHGRRLGFAAISVLEGMGPPATNLTYIGIVESGAPLAIWRREPATASTHLSAELLWTELPLKKVEDASDLQTQWRIATDPVLKEKLARRWAIREIVGEGPTSRLPLWIWRLGDSILIGQQNEAYSALQTQLRKNHPDRPIVVGNLINGSGGYLPPVEAYATDLYQVAHTPFASGSLEELIRVARSAIQFLIA